MEKDQISVAFVCLGNICRSPMAEAVFKDIVKKANLSHKFSNIDSYGTANYHVNDRSDPRTIETCERHNVPIDHKGQQFRKCHFGKFDYVIGMDEMNLRNLNNIKPESSKAVVKLFGDWGTDSQFGPFVEDPYYGGDEGFEDCYKQCVHFSQEFLRQELKADI